MRGISKDVPWRGQGDVIRSRAPSTSGKGDNRRQSSVDAETFASNWERTFGKKQEVSSTPDAK
jgi:hypothetical protein